MYGAAYAQLGHPFERDAHIKFALAHPNDKMPAHKTKKLKGLYS